MQLLNTFGRSVLPGIRNKLLETDDHICPSCDSMDVSPDGLIPNQMLRRAVTNFLNETGYTKVAQKAVQMKAMQAKLAEAAQAAAVLQKQNVVPKGPSVLNFKPPPKPAAPPQQPVGLLITFIISLQMGFERSP